jgi:hypothetical protein
MRIAPSIQLTLTEQTQFAAVGARPTDTRSPRSSRQDCTARGGGSRQSAHCHRRGEQSPNCGLVAAAFRDSPCRGDYPRRAPWRSTAEDPASPSGAYCDEHLAHAAVGGHASDGGVRRLPPQRVLWYFSLYPKRPFKIPCHQTQRTATAVVFPLEHHHS